MNFESVNKYFLDRHIQLKPEWLRSCLKFLEKYKKPVEHLNNYVFEQWLHTDIKESTKPSFQPPVGRLFASYAILQVESVLNISKPFYGQLREMEKNKNTDLDIGAEGDDRNTTSYWEEKPQRRMLKFVLTDGVKTIKAVEHISNPLISPSIQPGAKVIVTRCQLRDQILLLTPKNSQFLAGFVPKLVKKNNPLSIIKQMPFLQKQNDMSNVTVPKTNQPVTLPVDRKRKIDEIVINRPNTSGLQANGNNRTNINLSAQFNNTRPSTSHDPGPSTSGYRPQIVIEPKRPQIQIEINRRQSTTPNTRPTTTSTTPQQPNEPVCLSMQMGTRLKKTTTPTTTAPTNTRPSTSISIPLNSRKPAATRQIQQKPPDPQSKPSMKDMMKTPHGTNLTMDNFAVPKTLDQTKEAPKEQAKPAPPRPAILVTPQKLDKKAPVPKTTPLSTSSKINTPTSANSTRSSIAPCGGDFPYCCDHCEIGFKDRILYQIHMGLHGFKEPLTCNKCGHEAQTALDFNLHLYDH